MRLLAISVDPTFRSEKLTRDLGLAFPLLSDEDLAAARAFGVLDAENQISWPSVFLLDAGGRLRWRDLAPTYKLRPRPELLLEAVDALPSAAPGP